MEKVFKMTKKQKTKLRVDAIKDRMKCDDKFLLNCMLKIFSFQTDWEKKDDDTKTLNDEGFNSVDAEFLSSLSNQYIKKGRLSEKQIHYAKKKMIKYAGQIDRIDFANVIYLHGEQLVIPLIAEGLDDCDIVVLDSRGRKEYVPYDGGEIPFRNRGKFNRWSNNRHYTGQLKRDLEETYPVVYSA